jgi:ParB family chromosome partitioning protein
MDNTRKALTMVSANLDESMGLRPIDLQPRLSPVPNGRDAGRRPLRQFGKVEVSRVIPDPNQPREQFSEEALDRLASSIQRKGQLSPIKVRWSEEYQKWIIIFGERRWRAAQRAGLQEISCYFSEGDLSHMDILEEQLIENCLREDLQPIEEAKAFSELIKVRGCTGKDLAETLQISPSRVSRALALLKLPNEVQAKIAAGIVAARTGYEISRLQNEKTQVDLAQMAATGAVTAVQTGRQVRKRQGKPKSRLRSTKETFPTSHGWKVVVTGPAKATYGHIEEALLTALDEVRHRIQCGRSVF